MSQKSKNSITTGFKNSKNSNVIMNKNNLKDTHVLQNTEEEMRIKNT
jgi:hypothetical protein